MAFARLCLVGAGAHEKKRPFILYNKLTGFANSWLKQKAEGNATK
jgi:hypothetical protein